MQRASRYVGMRYVGMRYVGLLGSLLGLSALVPAPRSFAQDCMESPLLVHSDEFYLVASDAEGPSGGIIGVEISLVSEIPSKDLAGISVVVGHDAAALRLHTPSPAVSEAVAELAITVMPGQAGPGRPLQRDGGGEAVKVDIAVGSLASVIEPGRPLHLLTVYYEVLGEVGDRTEIEFLDGVVRSSASLSCYFNELYYVTEGAGGPEQARYLSRRHVAAAVEVVEGEPGTEPVLPPEAKVYPVSPTPEEANARFELAGVLALADASEAEVDLFIESGVDFTGFAAGISDSEEHLELLEVVARVPGVHLASHKPAGALEVFSIGSHRRLGAAGQRTRVATLRYRVLPGAPTEVDIGPRLVDWWEFPVDLRKEESPLTGNTIWVRHEGQSGLPTTAIVDAIDHSREGLLLVEGQIATRGDADLDGSRNVTDAIYLLDWLFRGGPSPACSEAADVNEDERHDISDAVSLLGFLFLGAPGPTREEVVCADAG